MADRIYDLHSQHLRSPKSTALLSNIDHVGYIFILAHNSHVVSTPDLIPCRTGRRAASNRIRGPQSALTDFLAANNISAAQINADYERRQRSAQEQHGQEPPLDNPTEATAEEFEEQVEIVETKKKRKLDQDLALAKIKQGKKSKKVKKKPRDNDDDEDDDDYDLGADMYAKKKALPGQLENCDECDVRFTVTPYSKTGSEGGLLCRKCSKKQDDDRKHEDKLKKVGQPREKRRQTQSNLLDGIVQIGSRSLLDHCLKVFQDLFIHAGYHG